MARKFKYDRIIRREKGYKISSFFNKAPSTVKKLTKIAHFLY